MFVLSMTALSGGGCDTERVLPIILRSSRELLHVRQKNCHLPNVFFLQRLVPGGHARVPNTIANYVVVVPLGIVGRIEGQLVDDDQRERLTGEFAQRFFSAATNTTLDAAQQSLQIQHPI